MAKTSKLFEYGLEAAKVGRILIEPEIRTPTGSRVGLTGDQIIGKSRQKEESL